MFAICNIHWLLQGHNYCEKNNLLFSLLHTIFNDIPLWLDLYLISEDSYVFVNADQMRHVPRHSFHLLFISLSYFFATGISLPAIFTSLLFIFSFPINYYFVFCIHCEKYFMHSCHRKFCRNYIWVKCGAALSQRQ